MLSTKPLLTRSALIVAILLVTPSLSTAAKPVNLSLPATKQLPKPGPIIGGGVVYGEGVGNSLTAARLQAQSNLTAQKRNLERGIPKDKKVVYDQESHQWTTIGNYSQYTITVPYTLQNK